MYRTVYYFSSVPAMLDDADALIALAQTHPAAAQILSACVAIVLAETLEQGTHTVLQASAESRSAGDDSEPSETPEAKLDIETLRHRVIQLPEILSDGKFQLDMKSPYVTAIHDLICLRNELMHVSEKPNVFTVSDRQLKAQDGNLKIEVKPPKNPWFSVSLDQVMTYRAAVELYVNEVMFPPDADICRSSIIVDSGRGRSRP